MTIKKDIIVSFLTVFLITAMLFTIRATSTTTRSTGAPYDPWADVSGPTPGKPDGIIDMMDLGYEAARYLTTGTPMDRTNLMSVAYDSGWVDITDMCGYYFNMSNPTGTTDVMVDIQGKTTLGGGVHQKYLGLTNYIPGWSKTYGTTYADQANSLVRTSDGGYAMAGFTWSVGNGDALLVKTDANGNMQWNKTYGWATDFDEANALVQTNDGGYAFAGATAPARAWLVKTDANGNMQWNKTYATTGNGFANSLVRTSDGGYALAGETDAAGSNDFWLIKTDASGNMQWQQTYGGGGDDEAYSVIQTKDGGYALLGYENSYGAGGYDFWLVKTVPNGNLNWSCSYGGAYDDQGYSLVQTSDGGYAMAGYTRSFGGGGQKAWLVKLDANGIMQMQQTYGAVYSLYNAYSLIQTSDGGYAFAGEGTSAGSDFWLVKTDASGNMQWNKIYGGTGYDIAMSLVQTGDGGYAMAGRTNSFGAGSYDFWLVKTDAEQGLAWVDSGPNFVTLYRGATDPWWNFVRVQIWTHG